MDAIRKYFWIYVAFVFLMVIGLHTCVKAIDDDAKQYKDKINRHHAETRQAYYVVERN